MGFDIEIMKILKEVDFLHVTFDFTKGVYYLYRKKSKTSVYIDTSSNHPLVIFKQILKSKSDRLSANSSSGGVFDNDKQQYAATLTKSGYAENLKI